MTGPMTALLTLLFAVAYVVGHAIASVTNIAVIRELRRWRGPAEQEVGPPRPSSAPFIQVVGVATPNVASVIVGIVIAFTNLFDAGTLTDRAADEVQDRRPAAVANVDRAVGQAGLTVQSSVLEDAVEELVDAPPLFSTSALEGVVSEIRKENPELADDVEEQVNSPTEQLAASVAEETGLSADDITEAIFADPQVAKDIEETLDLAVLSNREASLSEIEEPAALSGRVLVAISGVVVAGGLISTLMLFRILEKYRSEADRLRSAQSASERERRSPLRRG